MLVTKARPRSIPCLHMTDLSSFSLEGRGALVTGSSTGLGKTFATVLGNAGARAALNYQNNQSRAEATH